MSTKGNHANSRDEIKFITINSTVILL